MSYLSDMRLCVQNLLVTVK